VVPITLKTGHLTTAAFFVASALTVLVRLTHSPDLAIAYLAIGCFGIVLMETITVTVFLHRFLTHGSVNFHNKYVNMYFLWWARSGGVKFAEWALIHFFHHAYVDTPGDPHSPFYKNEQTNRGPLKPPIYFWCNPLMYRAFAIFLKTHPEFLESHRNSDIEFVRKNLPRLLNRLDELEWAHKDFDQTLRGQLIKFLLLADIAMPVILYFGPRAIVAAPIAYLATVFFYLTGGAIINYLGHHKLSVPHWSNIPKWVMYATLNVMGEGWHEFHHDAQFSARFHHMDPGWWTILLLNQLRLVSDIYVAEEVDAREYVPIPYPNCKVRLALAA
jgi:stearoyl-CoA desaturase (delta-9 desaturase)